MALTDTITPDSEIEAYMTLGPIAASSASRVLDLVIDHTDGIVDSDTSGWYIAAALTDTDEQSLANLDTGISVIADTEFGLTDPNFPGTSNIFMMGPYVVVGHAASLRLPLPAFTGIKYLTLVVYYFNAVGSPFPSVTGTIREVPVPMRASGWMEHDKNTYQSLGPAAVWPNGSIVSILIGSDAATNISVFPVVTTSSDENQATLTGGTNIIPSSATTFNGVNGETFAIATGRFRELRYQLPPISDGQARRVLIRMTNDTVSDIHTSALMHIEDGVVPLRGRNTRGRGRS